MPRLSAVGISVLPAQAVAEGQGRRGCQLSASAQNRTFAQIATCSTLAAGAGLMAMPLGPAGVTGAATVSSHLCDMAFERSRR
ncbi:hypothetical protein GALL_505420 [mine drainage metagenome]|uniref:Uncharacterized protein n=1 Tax=mine drainage metagenome TaxID=410659 RepID=A0A1J5P9D6_9ZZZZ